MRGDARVRPIIFACAIGCCAATFAGSADAADVDGAWASSLHACGDIFALEGSKASFRPNSGLYGSGFIIDGRRIRGPAANCTISRTKETGDIVHIIANCATDIMLSSVEFSLKIIDDNTIERIYPGVGDMEIRYYRCARGTGQ